MKQVYVDVIIEYFAKHLGYMHTVYAYQHIRLGAPRKEFALGPGLVLGGPV